MDHWRLSRVALPDAEGHGDLDVARLATDSLREVIRHSRVPDASARRVLAHIARLTHAGRGGS